MICYNVVHVQDLLSLNAGQKYCRMLQGEQSQGFFLVSSGAEIRPLSQWDLGVFFPNLKKKSQSQKKKNFFFRIFTHTHTHTHARARARARYIMTIY